MFVVVKFLNFQTPTNFTVNTLNFKLRGSSIVRMIPPNDAYGIANDEDPDQTAPLGSGSALFALVYLSENLGSLQYVC